MTDASSPILPGNVILQVGRVRRTAGFARRYGYAGARGNQTHDDLPFLHVGHRYYGENEDAPYLLVCL